MTPASWGKLALIATLFCALFWPNLRRLWEKTNPFTGEANWGHAICVPIIGIYFLYVHRDELSAARGQQFVFGRFLRPGRLVAGIAMLIVGAGMEMFLGRFASSIFAALGASLAVAVAMLGVMVILLDWSLAVTFFGLALYVYGIYPGQNDYLKDMGMIATLFGVVLLVYGWEVMKVAWFPILFLICAIPWPGLMYSKVAGPLQVLAAHVAVDTLQFTGVNAMCSGTKIIMAGMGMQPPRVLNVAEACAGLRSLMTFISVGAAIAFLSNRPLWQKLIITASAIPIAIFCNVMRISGQGLLDHYVSEKLSESFAHQFVGLIMLMPAFFLILLVGVVLDKIFVEEVDDADQPMVVAPILSRITTPLAAAPVNTAPPSQPKAGSAPVKAQPTKPAGPVAKPVTPPRPAGIAPMNPPRTRPLADIRPTTPPRTPPAQSPTAPKPPTGASPVKPPASPKTVTPSTPTDASLPTSPVNPGPTAQPPSPAPAPPNPNHPQEKP